MNLSFKGLLFDLDGTLVESTEAITRAWKAFALKYQIDINQLLPAVQGKPAHESIKALRPGASQNDIARDTQWLEAMEAEDTAGITALPGAKELLDTLNSRDIPWAIVTSGTLPVATARIEAANLPHPKVLVTPELLTQGKPAPEPYLLGAAKLGLNAGECIVVFEDTPAGIKSGIGAGASVVGVLTQFDQSDLLAEKAAVCVSSLMQVSLSLHGNKTVISIN